jgi:hypothetical protein
MSYDTAIIGGGPCGLAIAQALSAVGQTVVLFERASSIGGCHRVMRVPIAGESFFSHHSPIIYTDSYKTFKSLLKDMGTSFEELFVPYNFSIGTIGGKSVKSMRFPELVALLIVFIAAVLVPSFGDSISMESFMKAFRFSDQSYEFVDRLCRLTDGAGADRYSLHKFIALGNETLYTVYQPNAPNDQSLFLKWQKCLDERGVVVFTDCIVTSLDGTESLVETINTSKGKFTAKNVIIAIPPEPMFQLLKEGLYEHAFGDYKQQRAWAARCAYADYVAIAFHFNETQTLPKVWGFPSNAWGVAFIVLSDYMQFDNSSSKTVISVSVTLLNKVSPVTGKTANDSSTQEIIDEALRQLKEVFPSLGTPTQSIIPHNVSRAENGYESLDTAFVATPGEGSMGPNGLVSNLFSVGTHNGRATYPYTSLESAVDNAVRFVRDFAPDTKKQFKIYRQVTIFEIIRIVILVIALFKFRKSLPVMRRLRLR